MQRNLIPLVALAVFLNNCGTPNGGVVENITLGSALTGAADRAETVIRTAGEAGKGIVVQAGTEAYIAIQAAKVAYDDSLNTSVDKLDVATTRKLQEIQTMVNTLESRYSADLFLPQKCLSPAKLFNSARKCQTNSPSSISFPCQRSQF